METHAWVTREKLLNVSFVVRAMTIPGIRMYRAASVGFVPARPAKSMIAIVKLAMKVRIASVID